MKAALSIHIEQSRMFESEKIATYNYELSHGRLRQKSQTQAQISVNTNP